MISLNIYQVIDVKSPIDAYRLTTAQVNECLHHVYNAGERL